MLQDDSICLSLCVSVYLSLFLSSSDSSVCELMYMLISTRKIYFLVRNFFFGDLYEMQRENLCWRFISFNCVIRDNDAVNLEESVKAGKFQREV